jgi:hypothetical protein
MTTISDKSFTVYRLALHDARTSIKSLTWILGKRTEKRVVRKLRKSYISLVYKLMYTTTMCNESNMKENIKNNFIDIPHMGNCNYLAVHTSLRN